MDKYWCSLAMMTEYLLFVSAAGLVRLRIASLLTWWWDSAQDRSKLELLAVLSVLQNIIKSSALRKNLVLVPSLPARISGNHARS